MDSFRRLIDHIFLFLHFIWLRRSKPYVRVSIALITGGMAVLSAPLLVFLLHALDVSLPGSGGEAPWWFDHLIGVVLVLSGVIIFTVYYSKDLAPPRPPPSLTIRVGSNWTFEETALAVGEIAKRPVELERFSKSELNMQMRMQQISEETVELLLANIRTLVVGNGFPEYDVIAKGGTVIVRRK